MTLLRTLVITFAATIAIAIAPPALAQSSSDPDLEARAREVGRSLRCVVCQNQSIEDSDAALAADMRVLVRERLAAGDTEEQVIATMRDRYGDFVLLKPPVQGNTLILWFLPAFLVLLGGVWLLHSIRRSAPATGQQYVSSNQSK